MSRRSTRFSTLRAKLGFYKSSLKLVNIVRRPVDGDSEKVKKFVNKKSIGLFGDVDIDDLMCKSFTSIVLENETGDIVAAVCVNNYPNVPSIPPWSWSTWLYKKYDLRHVNSRNSLWVHLAIFNPHYRYRFLHQALEYLFNRFIHIHYIVFVVPPKCGHIGWIEECGTIITPVDCLDPYRSQNLYLCFRHDFVTNYKIRRAVVEDNDDLVDLINQYAKKLEQMYGKYYVAEMIGANHDPNRQLIVAELNGFPVAAMCVNSKINYDILNSVCKLEPFYGLKKPDAEDQVFEEEQLILPDMKVGKLQMDYEVLSLASFPDAIDNISRKIPCDDDVVSDIFEDDKLSYVLSLELFQSLIFDNDSYVESCYDDEMNNIPDENFIGHVESHVTCVVLSCTEEEVEKWSKKKKRTKTVSYKPNIQSFHGKDNAFALELVAASPEHEGALDLLLDACFDCFPELDYCVLCIPTTEDSFPLLKRFVRVTPRPSSNFSQEIFVAHKCAILGKLSARVANEQDVAKVRKLLPEFQNTTMILAEFIKSVKWSDTNKYSYVFFCGEQMIGFAVLRDQIDTEYIASHYHLSTWTNISRHKVGCHGCIDYFVMSPIFQKHTPFFLQELHRLSDYSILYYTVMPADLHPRSDRILATALSDLLPVSPSFIQEYHKTKEDQWKLPEFIESKQPPFALYISTPLHCGFSRPEVNTRIVVVGASDLGLSFIISLIFKDKPDYIVTYNNITLVSTTGISRHSKHTISKMLIPTRNNLNGDFINLHQLRTYVNVVNGVMSNINRRNKTITVNGTYLPYDLLFLTCGKQRQMPQRSEKLRGKRIEIPNNVFVVNTHLDAETSLRKLKSLIDEFGSTDYNVIVYGRCLEAYSCIAALQEFGVNNANIIFIEPVLKHEDTYKHAFTFNEGDVAEAVEEHLKQANIVRHVGYTFVDWTFNQENVTVVTFESLRRVLKIDCLAMFAYTERSVSARTHMAIHKAGLVFDGGLVIGPHCQTNDPNIYAAGTFTKYPRRYYADHMRHKYFNQEEIGRKLATYISRKLVTYMKRPKEETFGINCHDSHKMLVPHYKKPVTVYTKLPGKLYYLHVCKPGVQVPLEIATQTDEYGTVLTSGKCSTLDEQGYFRLHLNQYNTVETITCLAKFEIDRVNLTNLWGKHEKLLNNLVQRFEMVLIPDLFAYFNEPWTYAVYHNDFVKLSKHLNNILLLLTNVEGQSVIEHIISMINNNDGKALTKRQQEELSENFSGSHYEKMIVKKVLEFFADHFLYLPMYAHPLLVSVLLGGFEESPLFK